ncbi:MAG: M48 family metallopeptidase, partial [Limnobacter sp.]
VPVEFREQISLQDHQKAADYSIAKARLGMINVLIEASILMGFTLLGGLQWIQSVTSTTAEGILAGLLLIAVVGLIGSVLDLPLSYYKQFVLEERFGFNRMKKSLFIGDWIKGLLVGALIGGPLVFAV